MIKLREYESLAGRNAYRLWFNNLDVHLAVRVTTILERIAAGHKSSIAPVGEGVSEYKNDIGPGLRIYLGKDGEQLVILLGGGTKRTQSTDIEEAKLLWREYKAIKRAERTKPQMHFHQTANKGKSKNKKGK